MRHSRAVLALLSVMLFPSCGDKGGNSPDPRVQPGSNVQPPEKRNPGADRLPQLKLPERIFRGRPFAPNAEFGMGFALTSIVCHDPTKEEDKSNQSKPWYSVKLLVRDAAGKTVDQYPNSFSTVSWEKAFEGTWVKREFPELVVPNTAPQLIRFMLTKTQEKADYGSGSCVIDNEPQCLVVRDYKYSCSGQPSDLCGYVEDEPAECPKES